MSERGTPTPRTPETARRDPALQQRLWELAQDASRYLRTHASPAVRLATALLLAASLAACNASASDTTVMHEQTVAPLTSEVASGLPRGPGTYDVESGSVFRDQRGVYQFEWLDPGASAGAAGHVAHVSRLRLQRDDRLALEMVDGQDPVLHLPENENVGLIPEAPVGQAVQPGPQYHPPVYSFWSPFALGMLLGSRPAYYDPPTTVIVQSAPGDIASSTPTTGGTSTVGGGGRTGTSTITRVEGGRVSETARPPAQRVTGIQTAVSGRAGGTGSGSAVTARNASGGVSARSSSGVSAPRSGGFSGGIGSSGGSAAS